YDRYEEAALFAIDNNFKDRALLYVESMKARAFLDQLAEGHVEVEKGIDPELKVRRDQFEKDITAATNKISEEFRKDSPDDNVIASMRANLEHLTVELNRVIKQIRLQNPLYASVNYPVPVTVAELQSKVLTKDEVLLEYFISTRKLFCFVVTTDSFEIVELSEKVADLYANVQDILENISAISMGHAYDRILASQLYDTLIKPLEKSINGKTLVIVPDGILAMLPFEALVIMEEDKRSYLLEKYVVKYIQSASVLALIRKQGDSSQASRRFIGFGDPVYDYENFKKGKQESDARILGRGIGTANTRYAWLGGRLSRLEASGDEVRAINRIFQTKKIKTKTYLRDKARKDFAKAADMSLYGYIHFSMHGLVTPKMQAVVFSQIPDVGDDGLLTVNEIMNLRYNARLVVLSACQTGLGPVERGEGVTGLTRAVMYAGSPATAVSLWNVDDTGTQKLMTMFYGNIIGKNMGKAAALRKAKQDMLRNKYRHPYFWAAFVMYGE
ncbi:MAG: CHAT domain-containing protein, partial [Candidatus Aenigmarchaeota archaeon]|nr:CHAT domain-containing protein [Candidatus Aenigmarchaeota archaeon]